MQVELGGVSCLEEMEPDRSGRGLERVRGRVVVGEWGEEEVVREWDPGGIVYVQAVGKRLPINPGLPAPR